MHRRYAMGATPMQQRQAARRREEKRRSHKRDACLWVVTIMILYGLLLTGLNAIPAGSLEAVIAFVKSLW